MPIYRVGCLGIAAHDIVFALPALPKEGGKYSAHARSAVGGGCAANAAVAVARLGGSASLSAPLGDDAIGAAILAELHAEGVDTRACLRLAGLTSPLSTILIDDAGERALVNHADPALFAAQPDAALFSPADIVLADTRWPIGARALFERATAENLPRVLDFDRPPALGSETLVPRATHVIFAKAALDGLTGHDDPAAALRAVARDAAPAPFLAVTDGANGVWWRAASDAVHHLPAYPVRAVDTLAAGDAFHGAFALALAEGRSEVEALRFAGLVAALKCRRFGGRGGLPYRAEVDALLERA